MINLSSRKRFEASWSPQDPRGEPASELLSRIHPTRETTEAKKKSAKTKAKKPIRKQKAKFDA